MQSKNPDLIEILLRIKENSLTNHLETLTNTYDIQEVFFLLEKLGLLNKLGSNQSLNNYKLSEFANLILESYFIKGELFLDKLNSHESILNNISSELHSLQGISNDLRNIKTV